MFFFFIRSHFRRDGFELRISFAVSLIYSSAVRLDWIRFTFEWDAFNNRWRCRLAAERASTNIEMLINYLFFPDRCFFSASQSKINIYVIHALVLFFFSLYFICFFFGAIKIGYKNRMKCTVCSSRSQWQTNE